MNMIDAATAFGYAEPHPGACCACCYGHCLRSDWDPQPDERIIGYAHDGREWVSDRYLAFDSAALTDVHAETAFRANIGKMPSKATGPATGVIGDRTLAALDRLPGMTVADSDMENMHALMLDGAMVGYAMKGMRLVQLGWLPAEHLERARKVASRLVPVGEPALLVAARAIVAWLESEAEA